MRHHVKVGSLILGLAVAAGVAGIDVSGAHAMRFNPQPDPPGRAVASGTSAQPAHHAFQASLDQGMRLDFNRQPDPPGRRASTF